MKTEKAILDLDQLAVDIGVPYKVSELPNGVKRYATQWSVSYLVLAAAEIEKRTRGYTEMNVCGGGPHWLLALAVCTAFPRLKAYVITGLPVEARFEPLEMGEPTPAGGITFRRERREKRVYVEFQADDPDKPPLYGPHNYDRNLLPFVIVPEVEEEDSLYLKCQGEFSVIMNIISAYCGKCQSIHVAGTGADGYICIYTRNDKYSLGGESPIIE